jgi:hypothetical protein
MASHHDQEDGMSIDNQDAGFAWPLARTLTNAAGETMSIRPRAANLSLVKTAGIKRVGQCYRYYATKHGILTELQVLDWLAGGKNAVSECLSLIKKLFDGHKPPRISRQKLDNLNFDETTVHVCLRWLLHDGYISIENADGEQFLELIKWA